jgi:hypothetical protein
MAIVFEKIYATEPGVRVVCSTPNTAFTNAVLTYDIKCLECETGTMWNEECQDCVPICFPDMLAVLQIINSRLPAKIIE